jgi:hypothetical protein
LGGIGKSAAADQPQGQILPEESRGNGEKADEREGSERAHYYEKVHAEAHTPLSENEGERVHAMCRGDHISDCEPRGKTGHPELITVAKV